MARQATKAATAVVLLLLTAAGVVGADDSMLDSMLVIAGEPGSSSSTILGSTSSSSISSSTTSSSQRKLLQQQMSGEPEPLMKWLVDKHNELRYRHGVPALVWDWGLAWNAYNYIVGCPKGHSGQQGIGENLAWGHQDFNHAMRDWYDEIQFYNFNAPGFAENTGHMTQLIWAAAGKIGCAANLRCSFKTWICQFTPAGNLVNYGGSVDANLWSTNVPAPGPKYVTGSKPDGSPIYMSYDPNGESTRGLPQPRYGELKNFGYVPKPGQVVVLTDWLKFIPTDVLQTYVPWIVLEQFLKPDILALLTPEAAAVPKPGQAVHREPQRAVIGWQQYLPPSVVQQYVPAQVLVKYVPEGVVLATEKDGSSSGTTGKAPAPLQPASSSNSSSEPAAAAAPAITNAAPSISEPAPAAGPSIVTAAPSEGPRPSVGSVSKPQPAADTRKGAVVSDSIVASASTVWAAPMKEPYEKGSRAVANAAGAAGAVGTKARRQLTDAGESGSRAVRPSDPGESGSRRQLTDAGESGSRTFFRRGASAPQDASRPEAAVKPSASQPAQTASMVVREQGALGRLFGGLGGLGGDDADHRSYRRSSRRDRYDDPPPPQAPPGYVPVYVPASSLQQQQQPPPPAYYAPQQQQQQYVPQQQQQYVPQQQQQYVPPQQQQQYAPQQQQQYVPQQQQTAAVPNPGLPTTPAPTQQQPQQQQMAAVQLPQQPQQPTGPRLPPGMQDALDAHNFYRARHQAPPVVWDEAMAAVAQRVASACPSNPSGTEGVGENLAWGFKSAGAAVDEWYKEGKAFDFSSPAWSMTSGHFTQIVWIATERIGCGVAPSCSMSTVICHYDPPGNVMGGDWSEQVKPPLPGAPTGPRPKPLRQQPVAAVPMPPAYGVPQQQPQQQYQPVGAVPNPYAVPQQQQPVAAVPVPAGGGGYVVQQPQYQLQPQQPQQQVVYDQQQPQQQVVYQQPQQPQQAAGAVPRPGYDQQQQPAQLQQQPIAWQPPQQAPIMTYPTYQANQPQVPPVAAVPKPQAAAFTPVVGTSPGEAGQRHSTVLGAEGSAERGQQHNLIIGATDDVGASSVGQDDHRESKEQGAKGFSAPAYLTPAAQQQVAATTKPFSAPAFMSPLSAAVAKPTTITTATTPGRVSSRGGSLPANAPLQVDAAGASEPVAAAVGKPPFPVAVPRSQWPHVSRPVSSSGAPFSLSAPVQPYAAAVLSPELQQALDRHNHYRSAHQAPALTWDDSIASTAQAWASACPDGHSGTRGVGENMAWGYSSLSAAVDAWYSEVQQYDFNSPGWNTATGHFTALVWKSTTKLGCAINAACSWPTYVCQYGPPGNVIGVDWSQQVLPKVEVQPQPAVAEPSLSTPAPAAPKEPTEAPAVVNPSPAPLSATKPSPSPAPHKPAARKQKKAAAVLLTADQRTALEQHNRYRTKHGAPGLSWDPKLAAAAQAWADTCPWSYSSEAEGGGGAVQYGENMGWGYDSFVDVVEAWYSEVSDYDWSYPAYQYGSGHFTQLVWRSTTKVGCAVSKACEWRTFVCNYNPAGNVEDESWSSNVQPPTDAVPRPDTSAATTAAAVMKPDAGVASDASSPVAAVLKPEYTAALDRHNTYRQKHQAPLLVWDDALAVSAAKWASGCPNGHSGYAGVGENMAWCYSSLSAAVDAWYSEVQQYDFNSPGWNTATGHFTALVWKSTTKLGCATNSACSWPTYVCQYQSPGNVIGVDWSQQVKPALTAGSPTTAASPSPAPTIKSSSPAPLTTRSSPSPAISKSPSTKPVAVSASPAPAATIKLPVSPSPSPAPAQVKPAAVDMQKARELHNAYRQKHQAPALVWDEKLAASAKAWASTCTFGFSRTAGVGENLGFGYSALPDAVKSWYAQVSKYDFSNPGWKSGSGLFTQMVWRSTKAVGCAVNSACAWPMHVCHYAPAGNMVGPGIDWRQQVRPALAAVPKPQAVAGVGSGAKTAAVEPEDVPPTDDAAWGSQDPTAQQREPDSTTAVPQPARPTTAAVGYPDAASGGASQPPIDPDLLEAFTRTNLYRQKHQVTALSWDADLAAQAAAFVSACPLKHSTIRDIGESLGWGFRSFTDVVDAWYNEVNSYAFNKPGWSVLAGHFSQMVWTSTTRIGCAVNKQCTWDTFVCQYSPPGNDITADWASQVLPELPPEPSSGAGDSSSKGGLGVAVPDNPTLLPGEAYYNADRPANAASSGSDSDSSTTPTPSHQQYAKPVPISELQPGSDGTPPAPPPADSSPAGQDPPETPVTPDMASAATPADAAATPQAPVGTGAATIPPPPAAEYQVPTYQAATPPPYQQQQQQQPSSTSSDTAGVPPSTPDTITTAPGTDTATDTTTTRSGSSPVAGLSAELQAGLDATNNYRRQHNAPALEWDASITAQAAAYIAACPMGHSGAAGFGENLAWGYDSPSAAVKAWFDEVSAYNFAAGGFSGSTGHFTQLVWRDTASVGCAVNKACSMPTYICQYSPPGNVMGVDWSQQVQPLNPSAATAPASATTPTAPGAPTTAAPQKWWETPQQQPQQQQTPATPAAPQATPSASTADSSSSSAPAGYEGVLASTNKYRAKHQVPALTWDVALATRAQGYADSCPGGHSGDKGVGENLAWGYPSWTSAVDAWHSEVQQYSFSNPGWSGATGHFTQLVWKDTTKVGCGYNGRCAMATYVCQYSPAGNVLGDGWSRQVLPPTA